MTSQSDDHTPDVTSEGWPGCGRGSQPEQEAMYREVDHSHDLSSLSHLLARQPQPSPTVLACSSCRTMDFSTRNRETERKGETEWERNERRTRDNQGERRTRKRGCQTAQGDWLRGCQRSEHARSYKRASVHQRVCFERVYVCVQGGHAETNAGQTHTAREHTDSSLQHMLFGVTLRDTLRAVCVFVSICLSLYACLCMPVLARLLCWCMFPSLSLSLT